VYFDLFGPDMGWSHSETTFDANELNFNLAAKEIDDSTDEFGQYGIFCLPDDRRAYVRCCADWAGSQCIPCENGKSRAQGSEDFDNPYSFYTGGNGVSTWGSQTCS
jgi:hypothetical protein